MRAFFLAITLLPLAAEEESRFDSAPPATWQRHDPRALAGLAPALFDFSAGRCRIASAPPTTLGEYYAFGFARAGLFAPETFNDCAVSVDITDWSLTTNRSTDGTFISVLTRTQSPLDLLNFKGYSASIIDLGPGTPGDGIGRRARLQVVRVDSASAFVDLGGYQDINLDPARDYRLLLVSRGNVHTARVIDLSDPLGGFAQVSGTDATYTEGRTGIMVFTDRPAPADATFDNFLAWDGGPPAIAIRPGSAPGTLELASDYRRAMASDLESSTDLSPAGAPWLPAVPVSARIEGESFLSVFPLDGPRRFFRRSSL